jgi:hypothetical protein
MRIDPAVSVARPIEACPIATADAGPLEEPPGIPLGTAGFGGMP